MARELFVTGTDTGVGKTLVTAALLRLLRERGLRVRGLKPVASGAAPTPGGLRNDDALLLQAESSPPVDYDTVNPYCFAPACAPHLAAAELTSSGRRASQKRDIVNWLRGQSRPLTSMEIGNAAGLDRYMVARRLPDLEKDGLVERCAMRECAISRRPAITWRTR